MQDPDIGDKLKLLMKTIVNCMSGAAKDFHAREFAFFDKVTAVSGQIKPYAKEKRNAAIVVALKDIQVAVVGVCA